MGKPGLFRSDDAGVSWKLVPGQPTKYRPNHAVLASDGNLFVSYGTDPGPMPMVDGAVWKLDTRSGAWTDITPDKPDAQRKFGYGAVSVDARNPKVVIASSFYRPKGEEVFRSTDGGATWKPVFGSGGVYDYALAPYVKDTDIHWLFDIELDPSNGDHAMFTTGYGGWETYDLGNLDKNLPTHWSVMSPGIEETVALALYSPTKGAPLVTAIGDYSGFVHRDLDKPAPDGNPKPPFLGNTKDVSGAPLNPNVIVRVGHARKEGANLGYSAGRREDLARAGVAPRSEGQRRRHRGLCRRRDLGLDAARAHPVRHVGQWRELDSVRWAAEGDPRGGRSCEPQALLRDGALRREAVRERRRRGPLHREAAGPAGRAAEARRRR